MIAALRKNVVFSVLLADVSTTFLMLALANFKGNVSFYLLYSFLILRVILFIPVRIGRALISTVEITGPANQGGRRIRNHCVFSGVVLRGIGTAHIRGKLFHVAAWGDTEEGACESLIQLHGESYLR